MYFALPYWRHGRLPESSHESFRGRLAGLTPVHDELPPAPQVSQEAELSKHTLQDVAQPLGHRVRFADDPSAQLPLCTPSSPSARPALALKGCGDAPAPIQSFDFRQMLLSLLEACDYHGGAAHDIMAVRLSIARELRIAGHAAAADRMTFSIANYDPNLHLLTDSARVGLSQSLRALQSSEALAFCLACEAECSKVKSFEDLGRRIHRDCPCRPSPVSPDSEAATAACAPADRDACPGITGGVTDTIADVASVDDRATRSDIFEIGDVTLFEDIPAFTPKEALSAFDTPAEQLALLAAPDAQPISVQDTLAVGPSCSAEIDQMLVFFIILAAHCVAFPVQDGAAVAIFHSGCDPPCLNCF